MANYLRKYLIRFLVPAFVVTIILILIASFALNFFFKASKNKIEQEFRECFNRKISIQSIKYFPPNFITLKNAAVFKSAVPKENKLASFEKIKLKFSLSEFITKKKITVTDIYLNNPRLNYSECIRFLRENISQIITFINSLPEDQAVNLVVKKGLLILPREDKLITHIVIDTVFKLKGKSVSSFGTLHLDSFPLKAGGNLKPFSDSGGLRYNFEGSFSLPGVQQGLGLNSAEIQPLKTDLQFCKEGIPEADNLLSAHPFVSVRKKNPDQVKSLFLPGFTIENLEFQNGNASLRLWGVWKENVLALNGFLSPGRFSESQPGLKTGFNLRNRFRLLLYKWRVIPQIIGKSASIANIFDINCLIRTNFPSIQIENLSFSLNNIPFCLKGDILVLDPVSINLSFSSYPGQVKDTRSSNPKAIDLKVEGSLCEGKFNGKVKFACLRKTATKLSLQKVETSLKNLTFSFAKEKDLKMCFDQADLFYTAGSNLHKIFFKDFKAFFNLKDKRFKFVKFDSGIYDGFLQGQGRIDSETWPFKYVFDFQVRDISADKLESLVIYFSKVYGSFSSNIHYTNYPRQNLEGEMIIHGGYLNDFAFFKWLAQFFRIPALRKIDFDRLSSDFLVNDEIAGLNKISLRSKNVNMGGYFKLYENDLVSSKLSLGLSRELLETSPKFKSLLRLLDKDSSSLNFDFQLSGLFQVMNFKWLESDFKRKLQDSIPGFIERGIERKMENSINSISEEE